MSDLFKKLAAIDCSKYAEKKNGFTYLSWAWAVRELRENAPDATWEVKRFDGLPYLKTDAGYFVEVAVTVGGITLSQIHPVLDHRNKVIQSPDAFHINTSLQRCLVKAIALHGLGIYIYAGEDLPEAADGKEPENAAAKKQEAITPMTGVMDSYSPEERRALEELATDVTTRLKLDGPEKTHIYLVDQNLSNDDKTALWSLLDSKVRAALKKAMIKT